MSSKLFLHFHFGILPLATDESRSAGVLLQVTNCSLLVPGVPSPEHFPSGHSWSRSQGHTELSPSVPIIHPGAEFVPQSANSQRWEAQSLKPSPTFEFATPPGRAAPRTAGSSPGLGSPHSRGRGEPSPQAGTQPRDVPGCHCIYPASQELYPGCRRYKD